MSRRIPSPDLPALARASLLPLLVTLGVASLSACGGGGPETGDSLTNWLVECRSDADCDGSCLCGVCTLPCGVDDDCERAGPGATCRATDDATLRDRCAASPPSASGICVAECSADEECGDLECASLGLCLGCAPGRCEAGGYCAADGLSCECPPGTSGPRCENVSALRQLALGVSHACALDALGAIRCWGANDGGQLGIGDLDPRGDEPGEMGTALPTLDFGDAPPAIQLSLEAAHSCALFEGGEVRCWGEGAGGRLGQGSADVIGDEPLELATLPAIDLGGLRARQVIAGSGHSCALLEDASVRCWGVNDIGQLGLEDRRPRGALPGEMGDNLTPVDLGGGVAELTPLGNATCARLLDGSVKCWGMGALGQLGYGDSDHRGDDVGEMGELLPALDFGAGARATSLTSSGAFACAQLENGDWKCWGFNSRGQLALGDMNSRGDEPGEMGAALPILDLGEPFEEVVAGGDIACARLVAGGMVCWGQNGWGGLGIELPAGSHQGDETGEVGASLPRVLLPEGVTFERVAIGLGTVCGVDAGDVYCWGRGDFGVLGRGDTTSIGDDAGEMMSLSPLDLGF